MNYSSIILSIIVISHNQQKELQRCVESILAQGIPFAYELIISDDRSTDGTFERAQEYAKKYPHVIQATQCNSDDCNPANNSQRSGWNRCNGYKLATGKYIAHVDADDYFRANSTCLQQQVENLEAHPECSLCMQNVWNLVEGDDLESGHPWFEEGLITKGEIIDVQNFISNNRFIVHTAFVQRRNTQYDPIALYGKRYVDAVITFHHLQFGPIICIDTCDYVYVKYPKSISNTVTQTDDGWILYCLAIYIPILIPSLRNYFYKGGLSHIYKVIKYALRQYHLTERNYASISDLNVYIYKVFNNKLRIVDYARLLFLRAHLWIMIKTKSRSKFQLTLLHLLLTK